MKIKKQNNIIKSIDCDELLIIGLNDSQGVDTTFKINKKSFMYYIEKKLKKNEIQYKMIDCFSLFFNKTHYIDLFFKHNIDKKNIRLLQIHGNIMALKKSMIDYHLPVFISKIRNIYRFVYKKTNENIKITDELIQSKNPIIIYSSGSNDLMQMIGTDPLSVISHYKNRHVKPNFNYSVNMAKKTEIIDLVLKKIDNNLQRIYSYNNKSIILILGNYIPYSLRKDEMKDFLKLIEEYNNHLKQLCNKYNAVYIDTNEIGLKYNKRKYNFHISTKGHKELANIILKAIDNNKLDKKIPIIEKMKFDDKGISGIINDMNLIISEYKTKNICEDYFEKIRYNEVLNEYLNEIKVLEDINRKSKL